MINNNLIYAVDFDGTLCVNEFPRIGEPNKALINYLIAEQKKGNKVILWTCRVEKRLAEAVYWCAKQGLEFDAVNANLSEIVELWGSTRKVYADIYIDDKAENKPEYQVPYRGTM